MALEQLGSFMSALRQMESGGNYRAKGPSTKYGRATGAYQFLDSTWSGYGGYKSAFQAPAHIQDQRAAELMTNYYNQFGNWRLVAIAWHAGPGAARKEAKKPGYAYGIGDVNMRTGAYADKIMAAMTGGTGGGSYGAAATGADFGATTFDPVSARDRARELYGYLAAFLDHPEVGPVLLQGAQEGWSAERLQGALVNTFWWQNTAETTRQWEALLASDPATAERRIDETAQSIMVQSAQLGVGISPGRADEIAERANRFGWNAQEIRVGIAAEMRYRPGTEQGATAAIMQDVGKMAAAYMVPVTQRNQWDWARRIIGGGGDIDAVKAQMLSLAKTRFPYLTAQLDAGITPGQYFAPHRTAIAQMLEVSPDSINLMDPKWSPVSALHEDQKIRPMTLSEAGRFARMQPQWMQTQNAWQATTEASQGILEMFGAVA